MQSEQWWVNNRKERNKLRQRRKVLDPFLFALWECEPSDAKLSSARLLLYCRLRHGEKKGSQQTGRSNLMLSVSTKTAVYCLIFL